MFQHRLGIITDLCVCLIVLLVFHDFDVIIFCFIPNFIEKPYNSNLRGIHADTGKYFEVNPYKEFLCSLELYQTTNDEMTNVAQGVHIFLFISDEHIIVKQSKKSMLQNNIYK